MPTVNIPQRMNIMLRSSHDHPHGRVVELHPGWADIDDDDDDLLDHPVMKRLLPESARAHKRSKDQRDAEVERDEAIAEANEKYAKIMRDTGEEADDERAKETAAWEKRHAKAVEAGEHFDEPHPDPAVQSARAHTAGPGAPTPTATLQNAEWPDKDQPQKRVHEKDGSVHHSRQHRDDDDDDESPANKARGPEAADSDGLAAGTKAKEGEKSPGFSARGPAAADADGTVAGSKDATDPKPAIDKK